MARTLLTALIATLVVIGCGPSDYPQPETQTALKVEIADVVASGRVAPVDGITSAGQPDAEALSVFRNSGYSAVIDLRGPDEDRGFNEQEAVEALGMTYILLPITSDEDISYASARELDRLIEAQQGPVLVHCASANRVGALIALTASLDGADDEAAVAVGKEGGLTRLEPVVRDRLAEGPPAD